jgi:hypothetical protein
MPQQRNPRQRPGERRPNHERAFRQFWDVQLRVVLGGEAMTLKVCNTCCALVPAGDRAVARHVEYHMLLQAAIDSALPR